MKHTKIVATIGPSSESKEALRALIEAGVNVTRLNFSHGEHSWHREAINRIREVSEELGIPVGILADLQGPRIRIANEQETRISKGQRIRVSDTARRKDIGGGMSETILLDTPGIVASIRVGDAILIEDGTVRLRAIEQGEGFIIAESVGNAIIKPRKGVNLPDTDFDLPILSEKDRADLAFVLEEGVDFVGLSFVGKATDVDGARATMRELLPENAPLPMIISKIERKEAIKNLNEILRTTDAAMVARGDLGIEMPESEVALLQKDIIKRSLSSLRPVIVATQMMKSMTENPAPTRAEVSDVTNAVIDHADAVMLSEETAMGKYPVEVVSMMREIIERTEESPFDDVYKALSVNLHTEYAVMIRSVYELAKSFDAKAILLLSMSGFTARLISHFRPDREIFVATNNRKTWNQLALVWGISSYLFDGDRDLDSLLDRMIARAKDDEKLSVGDQTVVFLGRVPNKGDAMQLVGIREIR